MGYPDDIFILRLYKYTYVNKACFFRKTDFILHKQKMIIYVFFCHTKKNTFRAPFYLPMHGVVFRQSHHFSDYLHRTVFLGKRYEVSMCLKHAVTPFLCIILMVVSSLKKIYSFDLLFVFPQLIPLYKYTKRWSWKRYTL